MPCNVYFRTPRGKKKVGPSIKFLQEKQSLNYDESMLK